MRFHDLYRRLKESGFVIHPGPEALPEAVLRVAVMGDLSRVDVQEFLEAVTAAAPDKPSPVYVPRPTRGRET